MLKAKGLFLVVMTFLFVLTIGKVQAINLGLRVINEAAATNGYKLKLEIRGMNDPVYEHEIDLKISASVSEHFILEADLERLVPSGSIAASNTIVYLLKDGKVVATSRYVHSYRLDQVAGYQVKINTHKITPNDVNNQAISIVATSDKEGMLPLHK